MSTKLSPLAVAGRLYDYGYTADTLPRDEPSLVFLITRAFEGERLADLPANKSDFRAIRQYLELRTLAEERAA